MGEVINLAEQRELFRISAAVMAANWRTELAHIRLACGVIDAAACTAEIASVLEQLARLKSDLDAAVLKWPSNMEMENASQKVS